MKKSRIEREKQTVESMIRFYCRHKEGNRTLCPDCAALLAYAPVRLDRCPYGEEKPACHRCTTHCYRPQMRERIREVMRFAGPRMIFYDPCAAFRHLIRR